MKSFFDECFKSIIGSHFTSINHGIKAEKKRNLKLKTRMAIC